MARNEYKKIPNDDENEKSGFMSHLLFNWMDSTFKTGSKRALEESDFIPLSTENTSRAATELLQANWNNEKTKCKANVKGPKLWKSVLNMLSVKDITIFLLSSALYSVCKILLPLFIGYLISVLLSSEAQNTYLLYVSALAMLITSLFGAFGLHHICYRGELTGIRMSCALKGLIYHKVSVTDRLENIQTVTKIPMLADHLKGATSRFSAS